jgi:hypothetical protein
MEAWYARNRAQKASTAASRSAAGPSQAVAAPQAPSPAPATTAAPPAATRFTLPGAGDGPAAQAGGAVFALFLWPLIFNLVKGGPGQMWGWVKAKFINEPYSASGASTTGGAPATGPAASAASGQQSRQLAGRGLTGIYRSNL